ncbi:MAG: penicillin-binding protein [Bacteroidetes bacterium]|nr:MAG: penicillin-binding protein [Bacteroidota bacterium]
MLFSKIIKYVWIVFIVSLAFIALHVWALSTNFLGLSGEMPSLEVLENPKSEVASILYSADGIELGKYFRENRTPVEFEQISKNMLNALVATEDVRFESHPGIDFKAIVSIPFYLMLGKKKGSSTISQQLAKNLFDTRTSQYEGSLHGISKKLDMLMIKTKEWITAIRIERAYTKKEIITMYLNTVNFGSNAAGIKVASQTFFNTTQDKLTITQAAVLVGVLKAPSYYSPIYNPERAIMRRNTVIDQMEKYNFFTKIEAEKYKKDSLNLNYSVENHNQGIATYFRTVANNWLLNWCKARKIDLYSSGLKIYTTIDSRLQTHAENAVEKHMKYLQNQFDIHWKGRNPWVDQSMKEIIGFGETAIKRTEVYVYLKNKYDGNLDSINYYINKKRKMKVFSWKGERDTLFSSMDSMLYYKKFLQTGMIAVEPESGFIKAWVGGVDHKYFKYDHVKQSKRQPGSTFKPILYCAAMDNGFHPCQKVQDAPVSFYIEDTQTTWTPQNSDGPSTGEILTLRQAMARSINTIAAYVMKIIGPETVVDYAKKLGFSGPIDAVPALCLGISDVSIYELAGAYSTFANHGTYTEPIFITRIEDKNGNLIQEFMPKSSEALNEETAYTMLHMLKGGTEERGGTSLGLYRYPNLFGGNDVGGKTGTTQNYSDGWYVGVTQKLVTSVWVGGDDRSIHFRDFNFGQGARMAMPIFGIFMENAYLDKNLGLKKMPFNKPSSYNLELNCGKYTGKMPTDSTGSQDIYVPKKENKNDEI